MRTLTMKEEKRLEIIQRVFRGELIGGSAERLRVRHIIDPRVRHNNHYNLSSLFTCRQSRQHRTNIGLIAPQKLRHLAYPVPVLPDQ
jgi:hypothetical protein